MTFPAVAGVHLHSGQENRAQSYWPNLQGTTPVLRSLPINRYYQDNTVLRTTKISPSLPPYSSLLLLLSHPLGTSGDFARPLSPGFVWASPVFLEDRTWQLVVVCLVCIPTAHGFCETLTCETLPSPPCCVCHSGDWCLSSESVCISCMAPRHHHCCRWSCSWLSSRPCFFLSVLSISPVPSFPSLAALRLLLLPSCWFALVTQALRHTGSGTSDITKGAPSSPQTGRVGVSFCTWS